MVIKMNRNFYRIILTIGFSFILFSCLPDRMPTEPVEIERPSFAQFDMGQSNLNVALDNQISMYFNEAMDLSSFPACFKVESVSGEIKGTFSYGASDTIVVFKPSSNYNPAEYYEITLTGGIRDIHQNSVTSPTEEDVPQKGWFFTSGEYSTNGFPYVFIRDKANRNIIYRLGNLNIYKDNISIPGSVDYQVSAMEVEKNSDKLFIVNLKTTDGLVTIVDPASFSIINQLPVGLGPTNIEFSDQKAYVTNLSAKSFSVIDLNSLTTDSTYLFPDGFRPKDVSYSSYKNALYFYSSVNNDIKKVNSSDFTDSHIFTSGLTTRPTDIEITKDGRYLYMIGTNSNMLSIIDLESETANPISLDYQYLTDGIMGIDYYYVAYYRGTGGDNIGGILKIDINTNSIVGKLEWEYQVDQLKLTAAEELLYAVTPVDSTVQVIETKTMKNITSSKVEGNLKYLAITNKNY
jgi:hypothetical protein